MSLKYIISAILLGLLHQVYAGPSDSLWSVHGQTTIINQFKPAFNAPYSGPNSLLTGKEDRTSITSTLFISYKTGKYTYWVFNPEIAGGEGLSSTLGIGQATNGETFRIGDHAPAVYIARAYVSHIFPLNKQFDYITNDVNQPAGLKPTRYIQFTLGKVSVSDFFDKNSYSHDPRTQFMCWGLMSNGAWDYPANTRGYTPSAVLEYITPKNQFRTAVSMMPTVANGNIMDRNIRKSNSLTAEFTHITGPIQKPITFRFLGFYTSAHMGNYVEAISENPLHPNLVEVRRYGHHKYGFAFNMEQKLSEDLGYFIRAAWNDGNNETWAFTEIDRSLSGGISIKGERWHHSGAVFGSAMAIGGLSVPHYNYLAAGGTAFMLGDGKINYAPEYIWESYYSFPLLNEHILCGGAYQLLLNPAYNADRKGPVHVFSIRIHYQL